MCDEKIADGSYEWSLLGIEHPIINVIRSDASEKLTNAFFLQSHAKDLQRNTKSWQISIFTLQAVDSVIRFCFEPTCLLKYSFGPWISSYSTFWTVVFYLHALLCMHIWRHHKRTPLQGSWWNPDASYSYYPRVLLTVYQSVLPPACWIHIRSCWLAATWSSKMKINELLSVDMSVCNIQLTTCMRSENDWTAGLIWLLQLIRKNPTELYYCRKYTDFVHWILTRW